MSNFDHGSERRVFEAALQLEGEARESFLHELGLQRAELAQRVRALLAAHELSELNPTRLEIPASLWTEPSRESLPKTWAPSHSPAADSMEHEKVAQSGPHADSARAAASRLQPGLLLAGRYRIIALLGKGGMGEVYRAEDDTLGGEVALKILPDRAAGPRRLAQFHSEVRIARQVSHPHVCRVHDVDEADGLRFMTMELILGEDLATLLARPGPLPIPRAAEIGAQLCDGLGAVHEKGILHRDLKPANVMIDGDGEVRLADFGLAGLVGDAIPGGTPAYMAPELWADSGATGATVQSELYALGLILYELFTGTPPFDSGIPAELCRQHREDLPASPAERRPDLPAAVAETILCCLEKEPGSRPLSAAAVAAALRGGEIPAEAGRVVRLRPWSPPPLPSEPYPVLLPYRHRELLAGRDGEIERLCAWLELPRPIVGLSAPSGTGKSSLLAGGLYPALRDAGRPAVLERYPADPGIAGRLADGLLDAFGGITLADGDHSGFLALLDEATSLAGGVPPVLIVDQLEDLFRLPDARRARAVFGALLAATCRRRGGQDGPPCRWLLAYREEFAGRLDAWLRDVLADAEHIGFSVVGGRGEQLSSLPRDLSTQDRFQALPLAPLATPAGAATDPLAEATAVFRRVIEAPLELTDASGGRRYPWRFAGDGAERLARALAEARLAQPRAPLAPDLQVVLAHLLARATASPGRDGLRTVEVPDDVDRLIDRALEDHLRRALLIAFPDGRDAAQGRARALLALRELATADGTRDAALAEAVLGRAIGADGRRVLETLAGPAMRLVVPSAGSEGRRYRLSHDRLAEVVARVVEEEGRGGGLVVDSELLALRRQVGLQSALHLSGEPGATLLSRRVFRRIAAHSEALLWDSGRRAWWAACLRRRRAALWRRAAWAAVAVIALGVAALVLRGEVERRAERTAVLEQVAGGEPEVAAAALARALEKDGASFPRDQLLDALRGRERPFDLLELGLRGLPDSRRGELILEIGELALPLIEPSSPEASERTEKRNVRLASLLWALDYSPMRQPTLVTRAQALRDRALAPLWSARPPPDPEGEAWVDLPGGTFWMGAGPGQDTGEQGTGEQPSGGEGSGEGTVPKRVTVSAFQILAHEVTRADYRRLVPEHPGEAGDGDLPVNRVSWYEAMVYAAWLGGPGGTTRLPTEAEWDYAARAGCVRAPCTADGEVAEPGAVAWWVGNSADERGENQVQPVKTLAPNPYGVYDLVGNVWEWFSDWSGTPPPQDTHDPVGSPVVEIQYRLLGGGSAFVGAELMHPSSRAETPPERKAKSVGLRPVRSVPD